MAPLPSADDSPHPQSVPTDLPSAARVFALALWLGVVGFGGGFAAIGRIKRAVVDERRWMSPSGFIEHVAVASVLPGATATNLMVMLGQRLAGARGAASAAVGFMLPSALVMCALAAFYDTLRGVSTVGRFFEGMSVAVVGIVAAVAWDLRRTAVRRVWQWAVAAGAALVIALQWLSLLEAVAVAALAGVVASGAWRGRGPPPVDRASVGDEGEDAGRGPDSIAPMVALPAAVAMVAPPAAAATVLVVFAKISIATFGGGFAMIPAIAHESVSRGWLDERAFADAIALGQLTPGPVNISATFIGWRAAGPWGALAATVGMFGPTGILASLASRSLARVRESALVRGALLGLSPAIVGIIAAASWRLGVAGIHGWMGAAIALGALAARVAWPRSSMLWPLLAGGIVPAALGAVWP